MRFPLEPRTPIGIRIPGEPVFYWQDSVGDSTGEAGSVRLRKRMNHGVSLGGTFTWSKSLDDASTIGQGIGVVGANGQITGQTSVAQNPFDLTAERGLSSFDQEFRFIGDYLWQLPFGPERRWLNSPGIARNILGNWQVSGAGYGIHWPDLDEDLSTEGLLRGAPAAREPAHTDV